MNAFVYILQSDNDKYYVGSTTDLARRLRQHKTGHTKTTKKFHDFKLVFSQKFNSIQKARSVEKRIKSWKRRDFIDQIITDGIIRSV